MNTEVKLTDGMTPSQEKSAFHMEEYKALRAEILILKQQNFTIQKWVTVSLGVIYSLAYGSTTANTLLPKISQEMLLFAGLAVWAFGAFIYYVSDCTMYSIAGYIQQIEEYFAQDSKPKGWDSSHPVRTGITKSPFWWLGFIISSSAIVLHRLGIQL